MTGDVIYVFGEMDEDGFYMGQLAATGARGLVPSNFLAEAAPDPMTIQQQQHLQQQQQLAQQQQQVSLAWSNFLPSVCYLFFPKMSCDTMMW